MFKYPTRLANMASKFGSVLGKLMNVLQSNFTSLLGFFLVAALVISALFLTRDHTQRFTYRNRHTITSNKDPNCNLFSGKWVYDNESYPLYKEQQCFLPDDMTCEQNGRKDLNYQFWRWQPHDCDLPRFNATAFMEKIRGKRLVFVGDSLNRNQFSSILCLLDSVLPQSSKLLIKQQQQRIPVPEYNATIEFHWSPMLVESNCDNPVRQDAHNRTVRIESIEKHAKQWTDADILIFNSYTWWMVDQTITFLWGTFGSLESIYKNVTMWLRPFEMAIQTWSNWIEININRDKTKLFFMSMSSDHYRGEEWGAKNGENCYNEMEPILKKEKNWGKLINREMMEIVESAINKLERRGVKVQYLNITYLSAYRKEAHPTIYRSFQEPPSKEQLENPKTYSDCIHWCLPGVPDVWNQILYAYIMNS